MSDQWDEGDDEGGDTDVEWRRPWALYAVAALIVVAIVAGALVKLAGQQDDSTASHTRSAAASTRPTSPVPNPTRGSVATLPHRTPKVVRSPTKGPLLSHAPAGWRVVGIARPSADSSGRLLRIDPATGRITAQRIPWPPSTGPVSVVAGPGGILVRSIDEVPGFLFGHRGRDWRLRGGVLGVGGRALPGPAPNQIWTRDHRDPRLFRLVSIDGAPTGKAVRLQGSSMSNVVPDGAGYLMEVSLKGTWDLRPTSQRRITKGAVIAAGRRTFLVRSNSVGAARNLTVIDRSSGDHHSVKTPCTGPPMQAPSGTVSPDGRTAAILCNGSNNDVLFYLIDLRTGDHRRVPVRVRSYEPSLVWSPDRRHLLVVDRTGHLVTIDCTTGHATTIKGLPALDRIAPVRGSAD